MNGKDSLLNQSFCEISPDSVQKYFIMKKVVDELREKQGTFLDVRLLDKNQKILSDNLYWLPDSIGNYSGLQTMKKAFTKAEVRKIYEGKIEVIINNPANGPIAFFNRLSLVDDQTKKRVLPVFYSDNYFSVLPDEKKTIIVEYSPSIVKGKVSVSLSGWNVAEKYFPVR
jgi:hypothetical protein